MAGRTDDRQRGRRGPGPLRRAVRRLGRGIRNAARRLWNAPVLRRPRERVLAVVRPLWRRLPAPVQSFGRFLLVLLAVLAVVGAAGYRGGTGFDVLRRYLRYGSSDLAGGGTAFTYEFSAKNRFAALGDALAVLSDTELRLMDFSGQTVWTASVHMTDPALTTGGGRAAAFDVGGTTLYLLDAAGELMTLELEEDEPILSARLNKNGYLAVTSGQKNRKGVVRVYDTKQELVFAYYASRRFVVDACVTDDNTRLAAVTLGQEDGVFVSSILLYRLDRDEPEAAYDIPGALAAEIAQRGSALVTVSDTCLTFARTNGEVRASYDYGGSHLREYDLGGDGFVSLLLSRYQSGSLGRIVTVNLEGEELGALEVREEVLGLSAAGRYLAVLYPSRLVVYNQYLQEYASLSGTENLRQALLREDGSVLLLGGTSAGLFLP